MPDQPDQSDKSSIVNRFQSNIKLNSLDINPPPGQVKDKSNGLPVGEGLRDKGAPSPTDIARAIGGANARNMNSGGDGTFKPFQLDQSNREPVRKSEVVPQGQTQYSDLNVPRPKRQEFTAGEQIARGIEIPSALLAGYFASKKGNENAAAKANVKVGSLTEHAIPQELATDFTVSRTQLTAALKSKFHEAAGVVDNIVTSEPHLFEEGYRFEFEKAELSETLSKNLHRPGNLDEVIQALDNVPKSSLGVDQLKQVSEYAEHLGKSPLIQSEGLGQLAADLDASAVKFMEASAKAGPGVGGSTLTEAGLAAVEAEKEMYEKLATLRSNLGLKKAEADLVMQDMMKENPKLFEFGKRFEFDPEVSPEKVATLKRPHQLKELVELVEKTHAPSSEKLITSQGEHLMALKGISENPAIKSVGLTDMAQALESNAMKVTETRLNAFNMLSKEQASFMKRSMMVLGAGVGTNYQMDKMFFDKAVPGMLTHAANIGAPAILLTGFNAKVKFGVIVGSHLAARLAEREEPYVKKRSH